MLAGKEQNREEQLLELVEKMSELCRQYEAALQTITQERKKEREERKNRLVKGIAAARERGVQLGRKPVPKPKNFAVLVEKWEQGDMNIENLLETMGLKPTTFYKMLREHREKALI
jgi:DNA invertase Pin-like site-specific DNA recombinase